jgi:hypothetical protein
MGNNSQLRWVMDHKDLISGPIIEVGSRHYAPENAINYRQVCPNETFVGVDQSAGSNVDIVVDFTGPFETLMESLGHRTFKTVICCSVLEHVPNVFQMAQNISRITGENGILFMSVPFVWPFHGYPSDYWRFTPEAIKYLFPDFDFHTDLATYSATMREDKDLTPMSGINLNQYSCKKFPPSFKRLYQFLQRTGIVNFEKIIGKPFIAPRQQLMRSTMINMVGIKQREAVTDR